MDKDVGKDEIGREIGGEEINVSFGIGFRAIV
jgi:hypothetical protein